MEHVNKLQLKQQTRSVTRCVQSGLDKFRIMRAYRYIFLAPIALSLSLPLPPVCQLCASGFFFFFAPAMYNETQLICDDAPTGFFLSTIQQQVAPIKL
jgi:hypothetical protein